MREYASKIGEYFRKIRQGIEGLTAADNAKENAPETNILEIDGRRIDKNSGKILEE